MSSADSRALEATAWQRAILDELGAPVTGLARLPRRGAVQSGPGQGSLTEAEKTVLDRPYDPGLTPMDGTAVRTPSPSPPQNPATEVTALDPPPRVGPARRPGAAPPSYGPAREVRHPGAPSAPHPESLLRRSRHGDPMLRRVAREIRKVTGASQDTYQSTTLAEAVRQPVTTGRRIAVTSIRGGAGKSVMTALVATALAHFRQDRVLAVDADPGIGSLLLRLGMTSAPSLRHLADGRIDDAAFDSVRPYLAQTDAGVWVLGGTDERFDEVDLASYRAATNLLGRFFGVTVTDCGAGLTGELHEGVLADAHSQVMVTPATPDGVISARRALDMLAQDHGDLAVRTIVVLVTHAAGTGIDLGNAVATMPPWCPRVEHLAFDRHLAAGSIIDPARLAEPTRVTALRIAAAALTLAAGRGLPR